MKSKPRHWHGKTGVRLPDGHCSSCGAAGFSYRGDYSSDGVRGYRCMTCGTIKPELELELEPKPGANGGG